MSVFQLTKLLSQDQLTTVRWEEFLRSPELYAGIYELPGGGSDPQSPHAEDEVYFVAAGKGLIRIGQQDYPVEPGAIIYVPAWIGNRFHSFSSDLRLLVLFSTADVKPGHRYKGEHSFSLARLFAASDTPTTRSYRAILHSTALALGIDELPANGSTPYPPPATPHTGEKVYLVLSGRAAVQLGEETHAIGRGSIIHVPVGTQHQFSTVAQDTRLLVFAAAAQPATSGA